MRREGRSAEVQVARELVVKGQKDRALLALKRRKLHEQQLDRLVRNVPAAWPGTPLLQLLQSNVCAKLSRSEVSGLNNPEQGAWQLNVEQVLSNIEVSKQQKQLFVALKAGTAAVADMQKEVCPRLHHA
jgi:hypothetical protein